MSDKGSIQRRHGSGFTVLKLAEHHYLVAVLKSVVQDLMLNKSAEPTDKNIVIIAAILSGIDPVKVVELWQAGYFSGRYKIIYTENGFQNIIDQYALIFDESERTMWEKPVYTVELKGI